MESVMKSLLTNPTIITAIFVGASVLILVYILKMFHKKDVVEHKVKNEKLSHIDKKKESTQSGKTKKKVPENRWTARNEKQAYNHPWILTSLKGHTGTIRDINFSSNGKYLVSCADEDPDPGSLTTESSSSSSGSECNKENNRPPSVETSPTTKGLSRRQRKNRRREDSPPTRQKQRKKKSKKMAEEKKPKEQGVAIFPFVEFMNRRFSRRALHDLVGDYFLTTTQRIKMGYPVEFAEEPFLVIINKWVVFHVPSHSSNFDVNAREFVPMHLSANDSGNGSGSSSDSEESGNTSDNGKIAFYRAIVPATLLDDEIDSIRRYKRTCTRCGRHFFTTDREYLTKEHCLYHWGRLHYVSGQRTYTCCQGKTGSAGCTQGKLHVWDGVVNGVNGPYDDYVRTDAPARPPRDGVCGIYAIDCEMCYTVRGLEVTKVTVVGTDLRPVYSSYVLPDVEIVDYNTRFSGITADDMANKNPKSLREVQNDLLRFIHSTTVLVGHGLENDLRVLKIHHTVVIDTVYLFPHDRGLPMRRSLRSIVSACLLREIQGGPQGHDSYEDAAACMELMLWRVYRGIRPYLRRL